MTLSSMAVNVGFAVPAFVVVISLIVFVHEYGHYIVGRWCGVKIESFSLGMGPEIAGFYDKRGTRWRLSAFPIGGYVKFYGDANAASAGESDEVSSMSEKERALTLGGQPVWKRAAIVVAGPVANFLLAIAIFAGSYMIVGRQIVEPRINEVVASSRAEQAGLRPGDRFVAIDGEKIESFSDVSRIVSMRPESTMRIEVEREGKIVAVTVAPAVETETSRFGTVRQGRLGVKSDPKAQVTSKRYGPVDAIVMGAGDTWSIVVRTVEFIQGLFKGVEDPRQISGVIGMADLAGTVAQNSISNLVWLAALLSVSIGFMNLLPIPVLDGGHLMFFLIEAVRGRPLSERAQDIGMKLGMTFVLGLMAFSLVNDIAQRLPHF
jgi:regulator of sigma E protease